MEESVLVRCRKEDEKVIVGQLDSVHILIDLVTDTQIPKAPRSEGSRIT
jgi:hypothetical protein